jgi:hypothetical protein
VGRWEAARARFRNANAFEPTDHELMKATGFSRKVAERVKAALRVRRAEFQTIGGSDEDE